MSLTISEPTPRDLPSPILAAASVHPVVPGQPVCADTQKDHAGGTYESEATPKGSTTPKAESAAASDSYGQLVVLADILDDLERTRIANENRVRSLVQMGAPLRVTDPLEVIAKQIAAIEHSAELQLRRELRSTPLGAWVKETVGIGEKQGARLLASIGDPYWNTLHDRPRTVSELWAYAGYHVLHPGHTRADTHFRLAGVDPSRNPDHLSLDTHPNHAGVAPTRTRGQRANWSNTAKMRAYLCAEACMKQRTSPYRKVYDDTRAKYADAVHNVECKRCGPSGKPALPGSDLSDGHKHARALRAVAKAILKDLWRESKRLHELPHQPTTAPTPTSAPAGVA